MPDCAACGQANPDGFAFCGLRFQSGRPGSQARCAQDGDELLAQTLALAEKRSEAMDAARDALAIYEAKGDKAATEGARTLVASLSDGSAL